MKIISCKSLLVSITMGFMSLPSYAADEPKQKQPEVAKPKDEFTIVTSRDEKTVPKIVSGPWNGPRLPDGQPDVAGYWSNTIGFHFNLTDPQGINIGPPRSRRELGPRESRAPSRVSDPANGQVPFQPWAQAKVLDFQEHFDNPSKPQYVDTMARCAPAGVPKSIYWHGYEILQYPGYVLFYFDSGTRIIYLDGRPHLPSNVKLWNGDSRGHWEGNTLVVDVDNHNGKASLAATGEFISENNHIVEKYIFAEGGQRFNYEAVLTDPTVYTRPFTITVPARKWTEKDKPGGPQFKVTFAKHAGKERIIESEERTCVENNEGHGGVAL